MNARKFVWLFKYPILIFVVNEFVLTPLHVYERWPFIDIPMHALGGFAVALSIASVLSEWKKEKQFAANKLITCLFIVSCVALIAVGWEWYEWILIYIMKWQANTWNDTLKDLAMGILGAVIGAVTVVWKQD